MSSITCLKCRKRMATITKGLCDHCNYTALLDALIEGQRKELEASVQKKRLEWIAYGAPRTSRQIRCPKCGYDSRAFYNYCGRCGATLKSKPIICPNCRKWNSSSATFCRRCAAPLREEETKIY